MNIDVFVSRPNSLDENQEQTMQEIEELLEIRGLRARTIGKTDFPNVSPLVAVKNIIEQCSGAVILGFPQTIIQQGISKPNTINATNIENLLLPTPWNHIEASMAFMVNLPLLVIRDQGIESGIFDIGSTGNFIHTFPMGSKEFLRKPSFLQPFNEWYKEVLANSNVHLNV